MQNATYAEEIISQEGGAIEIPNTGVKLVILPDSFDKEVNQHNISLRIIPRGNYDKPTKSFSDHSTTMVEILPSNLKLKKPAQLTLPHCLKLRNPSACKVKIFMSHHEEGTKPFWFDLPRQDECEIYKLSDTGCTIWLHRFTWITYEINGEGVEAKKLIVYAVGEKCTQQTNQFKIDIGYYHKLPGEKIHNFSPRKFIGDYQDFVFTKQDTDINMLYLQATPDTWKIVGSSEQIIPYRDVVTGTNRSFPFVMHKQPSDVVELPICVFKLWKDEKYPAKLSINMKEHDGVEIEKSVDKYEDKKRSKSELPLIERDVATTSKSVKRMKTNLELPLIDSDVATTSKSVKRRKTNLENPYEKM